MQGVNLVSDGATPMALRASWTGHLKVSLVTIPVRLYNAVSSTARISFNQLHKDCGERIRYDLTCPVHGHVERSEIEKGYAFEKDRYVVIDDADLDQVRLETTKVIELTQFTPLDAIPATYLDQAFYLAPDGRMAAEAFATVREAMRRAGSAGIGRVVLSGREKVVALAPLDRGLVLTTLHYPYEVRRPTAYFEDVPEKVAEDDQLGLAEMLVQRMSRPFEPEAFEDRYQEQLMEIVRAKVAGRTPDITEPRRAAEVVDLMEALKRSLEQEGAAPDRPKKKPPARSAAPGEGRKRKTG